MLYVQVIHDVIFLLVRASWIAKMFPDNLLASSYICTFIDHFTSYTLLPLNSAVTIIAQCISRYNEHVAHAHMHTHMHTCTCTHTQLTSLFIYAIYPLPLSWTEEHTQFCTLLMLINIISTEHMQYNIVPPVWTCIHTHACTYTHTDAPIHIFWCEECSVQNVSPKEQAGRPWL